MMTLMGLIVSKPAQSSLKQLYPLKYIESAFIKRLLSHVNFAGLGGW